MEINFEKYQKVPSFKVLKQPGILSFDRVFLNAINLGLLLTLSKNDELDHMVETLKTKIDSFKENFSQYQEQIPCKWFNKINDEIEECQNFLKKFITFRPLTFRKAIIFLKINTKILCELSSIWFLTYQNKKPCLCESRKLFIYNMLVDYKATDLLSTAKPKFSCQEINIKDKTYYSLLPTNWDVVDYFIWIKNTNYWTKYWRNFKLIFDYMNDFDFDELILGITGIFKKNAPINCILYSKDTYLAFNYATSSRACKDYQKNLSFVNDLPSLPKLVIHDCINGYFIINK